MGDLRYRLCHSREFCCAALAQTLLISRSHIIDAFPNLQSPVSHDRWAVEPRRESTSHLSALMARRATCLARDLGGREPPRVSQHSTLPLGSFSDSCPCPSPREEIDSMSSLTMTRHRLRHPAACSGHLSRERPWCSDQLDRRCCCIEHRSMLESCLWMERGWDSRSWSSQISMMAALSITRRPSRTIENRAHHEGRQRLGWRAAE
jgi:hypothetical protein